MFPKVKKNGKRTVSIQSSYGSFTIEVQRYLDSAGLGSDYFSETGNFQDSLLSPKLRSYLYRYANKLSYRCLSKNIQENNYIFFTPAGIERAAITEAARLSKINEKAIAQTEAQEMPLIENKATIDVYDAESAEILLFYDGIGCKKQVKQRKDNPNRTPPDPKASKKVNTDVAVLQTTATTFEHLTDGIDQEGNILYSTMSLLQHHLKQHYGKTEQTLKMVAITDGATSIRNDLHQFISPDICIILDWYHLQKKVSSLMSMISPNKEDKQQHIKDINSALWKGNTNEAIAFLDAIKPRNKEKKDELLGYLSRHQSEIIDYGRRQKVGKSIGSGRGEKANDTLIANRQKKKGMAWSEKGSKTLAILAAKYA